MENGVTKRQELEKAHQMIGAMETSKQQKILRVTVRTVLWFSVPFLAMWSAGVDVTIAARCAVFPSVMATLMTVFSLLIMSIAAGIMKWMENQIELEDE